MKSLRKISISGGKMSLEGKWIKCECGKRIVDVYAEWDDDKGEWFCDDCKGERKFVIDDAVEY